MKMSGAGSGGVPRTTMKSFWDRVDLRGPDDCWNWIGYVNDRGYGNVTIGNLNRQCHAVAYELVMGHVPTQDKHGWPLELDHLCRNKACVNPKHLEPVTHQENLLRNPNNGQSNSRKTHCKYGHPYDEVNTYKVRPWKRDCITCRKIYMEKYNARRREERQNSRNGSST